ncbi:MAG: dehypoxanthine futalosine cyclase [Planctomycetales bacterium]|nr:dehypoxanthine futalosine cyclase [Planctomycetales bacterium]
MVAAVETSSRATEALAKARAGERLSVPEARCLYTEASLLDLGAAARARRQALVPGREVTYLVDRNINYTNVCLTDCLFCAFYRPPGHPESYTLTRDQIAGKIEELRAVGGTRILMQGGHNPALRIGWYEDLLRWLRATFPDIEVDAFSPSEIGHLADLEGMTMRDVLARLKDCGLAGLPGGGGEILHDEIRHRVSPKKQKTDGWLEAMRHAQSLGLVTSSTMVIGFSETVDHRLSHLSRLRDHQDRSLAEFGNGFGSFISWTVQLENTPLGASRHRPRYGAGGQEYLRHLAIGRLFLDNTRHHQASWPTQGLKLAQVALEFGADDFGSTMLEENVVSAAGTERCRVMVEEIHREIRDAGYEPVQRDSRYRVVRRFEPEPAGVA